jgi:hypothetical protein
MDNLIEAFFLWCEILGNILDVVINLFVVLGYLLIIGLIGALMWLIVPVWVNIIFGALLALFLGSYGYVLWKDKDNG